MVEESSYGDWLIQERIDMKSAVPLASPVETEIKTEDILKIIKETNPADTVIDVNMNDASEKPKDVKETEKPANTKDEIHKKDEPPPSRN